MEVHALSNEALRHLHRFCEEQKAGRAGSHDWDMFITSAHKERTLPDYHSLLAWLRQNLPQHTNVESLAQDFDRAGKLLQCLSAYSSLGLGKNNVQLLREMACEAIPGGMPLGVYSPEHSNNGCMEERVLSVSPQMRQSNPHVLALGLDGHGKTCFLTRMLAHDIETGDRAIVILDSNGALINFLDSWISNHPRATDFIERTIIIDPTLDSQFPAYNPCEYPLDGDLQAAARAIECAFRAARYVATGEPWPSHTATLLRNSVMVLIANNATLAQLPTFLLDHDYRSILLDNVLRQRESKIELMPIATAVWEHYERVSQTDHWFKWIEPILDAILPVLSDSHLQHMVGQSESTLHLEEVLSARKILFVKLPRTHHDDSASLIANLLVHGLLRLQASRRQEESGREPCALFVDELCDFFDWQTVLDITSEREHQIEFIGVAQTLQNIAASRRNRLINSFGTIAAFALEPADGTALTPLMNRLDGALQERSVAFEQEKLNVEQLVKQRPGRYMIFRNGAESGTFPAQAPEFPFSD